MTAPNNSSSKGQAKPGFSNRISKRVRALLFTGVVVASAGIVVWQGSGLIANRAAAVEAQPATDPIAVRSAMINIVNHYEVERSFSGQIEAPQSVGLSFEQGGTIVSSTVDEGSVVAKGQVLAKLDDRLLMAERKRL